MFGEAVQHGKSRLIGFFFEGGDLIFGCRQLDAASGKVNVTAVKALLVNYTELTADEKARAADLAEQCVANPEKVLAVNGWLAVQASSCMTRAFAMVTGMKVTVVSFSFLNTTHQATFLKKKTWTSVAILIVDYLVRTVVLSDMDQCCHFYIGLPRAHHFSSNVFQCCHAFIGLPRARSLPPTCTSVAISTFH